MEVARAGRASTAMNLPSYIQYIRIAFVYPPGRSNVAALELVSIFEGGMSLLRMILPCMFSEIKLLEGNVVCRIVCFRRPHIL
jgi:hypothetical protein